MLGAELRDGDPLRQRDAARAPIVEMLGGQAKMGSNNFTTKPVDQRAIGVLARGHATSINGAFMKGNTITLIELHVSRSLRVDVIEVGKRIEQRIAEMGREQAEVAKATGLSVQRLNNYIKGRRPPDIESLVKLAKTLRVSADYLLGISEQAPTDTKAVILRLLELDGMDQPRAEAIADAAAGALQLLSSLPDEGDARFRARVAAQAAWQTRPSAKPS